MTYVVGGMLNRVIGERLGISEKTVKIHRGRIMKKMQARSLAHLVRMAQTAGIEVHEPDVGGPARTSSAS